jgi:hypothetical protein
LSLKTTGSNRSSSREELLEFGSRYDTFSDLGEMVPATKSTPNLGYPHLGKDLPFLGEESSFARHTHDGAATA